MKKITVLAFALAIFFVQTVLAANAPDSITAYFFYGEGCPHCAKELKFLQEIQMEHPDLEIKKFEIYHNKENALFLKEIGQFLGEDIKGVPFLVIGDKHFAGYADNITSIEIENKIKECASGQCSDMMANISKANDEKKQNTDKPNENNKEGNLEKMINLPFWGNVNIANFSLPILTVTIGLLDGFNPCAMWVLLFLISLLLGMKDRKKMWILGTAFIVASAFVYFMFMSAWLNLILFLGFIIWIRLLIGILALFSGSYNIKEFLSNKNSGSCKVVHDKSRKKIFQRLKSIISKNNFWLALGGIVVLAFMVNLVELICSAGLPAIYTQVLVLNNLAKWQYYLYILLYIFFFMLDDLLVFFIAMITFRITGVTTKYSKYSQLIGGLAMLIIGLLLIFKPQWLMFG